MMETQVPAQGATPAAHSMSLYDLAKSVNYTWIRTTKVFRAARAHFPATGAIHLPVRPRYRAILRKGFEAGRNGIDQRSLHAGVCGNDPRHQCEGVARRQGWTGGSRGDPFAGRGSDDVDEFDQGIVRDTASVSVCLPAECAA